MIKHINAIRKVPGLQNSLIVIIPESNLGWEAQRHEQDIKKSGLKNIIFIKEDGNHGGTGYRMDKNNKNAMGMAFKSKLESEKVVFHKNFICIDEENSPAAMKDEIVKQCGNYSRKIVIPNDVNKRPEIFWGGKSGYGYDDNCICVQALLLYKRVFLTSEKYSCFRQ